MITPRPYQREAIDAIFRALRVSPSTMLVAATGTGKTAIFSLICHEAPREWGRILILAHRRELVKQAWKMCRRVCSGDRVDMEMDTYHAQHKPDMFGDPPRIVVASKDTLGSRLAQYDPKEFGLVITDECHHDVKKNKTYYKIRKHFTHAKYLGVTATPDRLDEEAMGGSYATVAYVYDILQAVTDSWLVPIQQQLITVEGLDLSFVKSLGAGDLDPHELDFAMKREPVIHGIVYPVIELANSGGQRRPTLFFGTSVEQARMMAEICNRHQPGSAVALSGEDDKERRDDELERFDKGQFQYLCGCQLFTEGFDQPKIRIVVPKPTESRANYAQQVGRGTRSWPGVLDDPRCLYDMAYRREMIRRSPKPSLLVCDPHGVSGQHKLITTIDLLGGVFSPEVREAAKKALEKKGGEGKRGEALSELREAREMLRLAEEDRRKAIVIKAIYTRRPVDPFALFDVAPKKAPAYLRGRLATRKQVEYLERHAPEGTRFDDSLSMHEAGVLIQAIKTEKDAGPPTEKMSLALQRYGFDTSAMTYLDAKARLDELAASGWQRSGQATGPAPAMA